MSISFQYCKDQIVAIHKTLATLDGIDWSTSNLYCILGCLCDSTLHQFNICFPSFEKQWLNKLEIVATYSTCIFCWFVYSAVGDALIGILRFSVKDNIPNIRFSFESTVYTVTAYKAASATSLLLSNISLCFWLIICPYSWRFQNVSSSCQMQG